MSVPIVNIMEPADWQDREMERLEAENAKLRELVRDMWEDVCNAPCCAYCDHSDYDGDKCELRDRMRELGVEV